MGPRPGCSGCGLAAAGIDVIAPVEAGRKIAGIGRRFVPPPVGGEVWRRHGVPLTSPARTIVDCAGISTRAASAADRAGVGGGRARRQRDRPGPRRAAATGTKTLLRGARALAPLPARDQDPQPHGGQAAAAPDRSRRCRSRRPTRSLRLGGKIYEVDFLWREQKLVVETDGGRFHDNPAAGERDSERNRALAEAGYRLPRLGWEDLRDRPEATMARDRPPPPLEARRRRGRQRATCAFRRFSPTQPTRPRCRSCDEAVVRSGRDPAGVRRPRRPCAERASSEADGAGPTAEARRRLASSASVTPGGGDRDPARPRVRTF